MKSKPICSQCLRALRQNSQAQSSRSVHTVFTRSRPISTQTSRWQQQAAQKDPIPPPMPTTAGTVTTNIAPAQEFKAAESKKSSESSKLPPEGFSTAEMQKRINNSLSTPGITTKLAQTFAEKSKGVTESYFTYGRTEILFKSCASQAPYTIPEDQRMGMLSGKGPPKTAGGEDLGKPESESWWFSDVGLEPTFSTWSQVAFLHMYVVTVRLRALGDSSAFINYQRYLLEHFSHAAEDKMLLLHNMSARGIRNRYLKDLFLQWRGILAAYDEGLIQSDAILGGAVWRNLFKADENVDWEKVAVVVGYLRKAINSSALIPIEDMIHQLDGSNGLWARSRNNVEALAEKPSKGLQESLNAEEV